MDQLKKISLIQSLFLFVLAIFFFLGIHPDIYNTARNALPLLDGHWLEFYEFNIKNKVIDDGAAYPFGMYLIFALWMLPLKIISLIPDIRLLDVKEVPSWFLVYIKILPLIFTILSAQLLKKLYLILAEKSYSIRFDFLTSPFVLFSVIFFAGYDIIPLYFILYGLYYLLKNRPLMASGLFATSILFKPYALIIALPWLFLYHQKIISLFLSLLVFVLPDIILKQFFSIPGSAFKQMVLGFNGRERILFPVFKLQNFEVHIFLLLFFVLLVACFFTDKERVHLWKNKLINISFPLWAIFFSLILWHPQWLILMVPFYLLINLNDEDKKFYFVLFELVLFFFFIGFICNVPYWQGHLDEGLLRFSFLKNYEWHEHGLVLKKVFKAPFKRESLYYTGFVGTLISWLIFHWQYKNIKPYLIDFDKTFKKRIIFFRHYLVIPLYGILLVLCYFF